MTHQLRNRQKISLSLRHSQGDSYERGRILQNV